ncbi:MAG: serine/threonine-protein kinase [Proteobacteria bacterium]|nr:serine/threonine-protein kinase [Pseudomonadota bacterium]
MSMERDELSTERQQVGIDPLATTHVDRPMGDRQSDTDTGMANREDGTAVAEETVLDDESEHAPGGVTQGSVTLHLPPERSQGPPATVHLDPLQPAGAPLVPQRAGHLRGARALPIPQRAGHMRGTHMGRYTIIDAVGSGGMGTVYAAYDPELRRRVAIKVLHLSAARSAADQQRLMREARALAKLSHPNVVQVYDAGMYEGDVFVAMEFVAGTSMDAWCRRTPRPGWREVLASYCQAGRGLAAAHAEELIHRDFKPANIMVGNDGRARVADFGLASALTRYRAGQNAGRRPEGRTRAIPETTQPLTSIGTIMGTPAFMAPEQHLGVDVGPQSDQYSFCVSLYCGLYGEPPFSAKDTTELFENKRTGKIAPPPRHSEVPLWLRSVLERGLRAQPTERWPSMDALLAALADDPAQRRRVRLRIAAVVAMFSVLTALAFLGWMQNPKREAGRICESVTDLRGVWDDRIASKVQAGFLATELPYARDTYARVAAALDRHALAWKTMATEACQATHVAGMQSPRALDLRVQCLTRRKSSMAALTGLFAAGADAGVVENAVQAVRRLPSVSYCGDLKALMAAVPVPENPTVRARIDQLQAARVKAEALARTGKYRAALDASLALMEESADIEYAPMRAQIMELVAEIKKYLGDYSGAETLYRQALRVAAKARDHIRIARMASELIYVTFRQGRSNDALGLVDLATITADLAGDDLITARLASAMGGVFHQEGRYEEALGKLQGALALRENVLGEENILVADSYDHVGIVFISTGRYQESLDMHRRAAAIRDKLLGPEHPRTAISLINVAEALIELSDIAEALRLVQRALAITQKALGPHNPKVAYALTNLARIQGKMGNYDEAQKTFERALSMWNDWLGNKHPLVTENLVRLGEVLEAAKEPVKALEWLERAVANVGDKSTDLAAMAKFALARSLWLARTPGQRQGLLGANQRRAIALARRAQELYRTFGNRSKLAEVDGWLDKRQPASLQP